MPGAGNRQARLDQNPKRLATGGSAARHRRLAAPGQRLGRQPLKPHRRDRRQSALPAQPAQETTREAALEAKEIAAINRQRAQQLAERFQTDPAGAVAKYVQDKKDELAILDWAGEFGGKFGDAWDIAQQGDLGKAAGEMASALGSAAKKAAIRKKQKMAAQKKADDKGKGRWAAKKDNVDFEKKLESLKEEMKGATLTYRVCRVQLEHDPSGCYGQRVSGKGKLSPAGQKTGFCRRKKGTDIRCEPWTPSEKPGKTR